MGEKSAIEWTDATWSPIRAMTATPDGPKFGWHCEHVSDGCRNCYAEAINRRLGTGLDFKPGNLLHQNRNGDRRGEASLFLDDKMLTAPLRWKRPRRVFVCSMTDLFADFVPDAMIDRVFAVMALAPQHVFQVLTKRSKRMREYLEKSQGCINGAIWSLLGTPAGSKIEHGGNWRKSLPLPNVWLGVSVEDQPHADERIPDLLATPAAVRFVSAEPLLGKIGGHDGVNALSGYDRIKGTLGGAGPRIDLVIVGGESGPGARACWTPNVRSIVKQCRSANVPVFVKQLGANVRDRNDAGFDGENFDGLPKSKEWPAGTADRVEHDLDGTRDDYQGAPVRIRLRDRKGGDMAEWPEDLRVGELPR